MRTKVLYLALVVCFIHAELVECNIDSLMGNHPDYLDSFAPQFSNLRNGHPVQTSETHKRLNRHMMTVRSFQPCGTEDRSILLSRTHDDKRLAPLCCRSCFDDVDGTHTTAAPTENIFSNVFTRLSLNIPLSKGTEGYYVLNNYPLTHLPTSVSDNKMIVNMKHPHFTGNVDEMLPLKDNVTLDVYVSPILTHIPYQYSRHQIPMNKRFRSHVYQSHNESRINNIDKTNMYGFEFVKDVNQYDVSFVRGLLSTTNKHLTDSAVSSYYNHRGDILNDALLARLKENSADIRGVFNMRYYNKGGLSCPINSTHARLIEMITTQPFCRLYTPSIAEDHKIMVFVNVTNHSQGKTSSLTYMVNQNDQYKAISSNKFKRTIRTKNRLYPLQDKIRYTNRRILGPSSKLDYKGARKDLDVMTPKFDIEETVLYCDYRMNEKGSLSNKFVDSDTFYTFIDKKNASGIFNVGNIMSPSSNAHNIFSISSSFNLDVCQNIQQLNDNYDPLTSQHSLNHIIQEYLNDRFIKHTPLSIIDQAYDPVNDVVAGHSISKSSLHTKLFGPSPANVLFTRGIAKDSDLLYSKKIGPGVMFSDNRFSDERLWVLDLDIDITDRLITHSFVQRLHYDDMITKRTIKSHLSSSEFRVIGNSDDDDQAPYTTVVGSINIVTCLPQSAERRQFINNDPTHVGIEKYTEYQDYVFNMTIPLSSAEPLLSDIQLSLFDTLSLNHTSESNIQDILINYSQRTVNANLAITLPSYIPNYKSTTGNDYLCTRLVPFQMQGLVRTDMLNEELDSDGVVNVVNLASAVITVHSAKDPSLLLDEPTVIPLSLVINNDPEKERPPLFETSHIIVGSESVTVSDSDYDIDSGANNIMVRVDLNDATSDNVENTPQNYWFWLTTILTAFVIIMIPVLCFFTYMYRL